MRERLRRIHSTTIALYVLAVDAIVWLAAMPFELAARTFVTHSHPSAALLVGLLVLNVLLLALVISGAVATMAIQPRMGFVFIGFLPCWFQAFPPIPMPPARSRVVFAEKRRGNKRHPACHRRDKYWEGILRARFSRANGSGLPRSRIRIATRSKPSAQGGEAGTLGIGPGGDGFLSVPSAGRPCGAFRQASYPQGAGGSNVRTARGARARVRGPNQKRRMFPGLFARARRRGACRCRRRCRGTSAPAG